MLRVFRQSPVLLLSLVALGALLVLMARDLNIGHLQTDVIILRAWMREVGEAGFTDRYFSVNQRHLLVGPVYTLAYQLFGENNLPYNIIFQASRLLQGVFLGGVVYQFARHWTLALCAGLALMFTPVRLPELYQGINWYIEPTLTMLVASSYFYLLALRARAGRGLAYVMSVSLFVVSILIYESGLPWVGVQLFLGVMARESMPIRRRLLLAVWDALLPLAAALILAWLVLFVFEPWDTLKPDVSGSLVDRLLVSLATLPGFPVLWARLGMIAARDGYLLPVAVFGVLGGALTMLVVYLFGRTPAAESDSGPILPVVYGRLFALALVMFGLSLIVGASSGNISPAYLDRITFGRVVGIALFYVTAIFAVVQVLRLRPVLASGVCGSLLAGVGFAWLLMYQGYAHAAFGEIDRLAGGIAQLRQSIYAPAHFILVTDDDWVGARFNDAADVIAHETQQKLWALGTDSTVDILHTAAHPEEVAVSPGTCDTLSDESSAGMCLDENGVWVSRWATGAHHPYADVILLRYEDDTGQLAVIDSVRLADLAGYNIASAGPDVLRTNPDRLAVPPPLETVVR